MTVILREPKRKHRGNVAETPPFPIHTEQATGIPVCEATWHIYTGRFNGDSVIVEKFEDISALYTMGYYGKGSLSRGCALLGRAKRNHPQFIKESQWQRHKQWKELDLLNKETECATSESSVKHEDKEGNNKSCDQEPDDKTSGSLNEKSEEKTGAKELSVTISDDAESECSDIVEVENSDEAKNGKRKRDSESPSPPSKRRNPAAGEQIVRNPAAEEPIIRNPAAEEPKVRSPVAGEPQVRNPAVEESVVRNPAAAEPPVEDPAVEDPKSDQSNIEIVDLSSDDESPCSEQNENRNSSTLEVPKPACSSSAGGSARCEETEVVVLAGVDSEDEDYLANLKPRLEYEPSNLSQEKLILSLEEAMFLSYGLGCLQILGMTGEELSLLETWKLFQESQRTFVQRYVAYHYFRSKGWVVKSGLKFGGDFVLYKEGPHLYHSSYVVVVQVINKETSARDTARDRRPMSWTQLMGLNRLSEAAGKDVLLCQVIWPANHQGKNLESPRVISSFRVQEVLIKRWVASQDRTDHLKNREENLNPENSAESACA